MKKWKIIIGSCLVFSTLLAQAQEKKTANGRIGIEFGSGSVYGETVTPERIRASKSLNEWDFFCGFPTGDQTAETVYSGIKYEYFLYNNRLGLTAGLRFSTLSSTLESNNYRYFLWLFRQEDLNTDFLRIQNIKQRNCYLGIPLEIRFFPKKRDSFFKQYFKLGVATNYLLSSKNTIAFYDNTMSQYAGAVGKQIDKPDLFNAYIYPAYGFKFGKGKGVWFNMEFHFPGFLTGKKAHPFIRQNMGIGIQLSAQMPVSKIIK